MIDARQQWAAADRNKHAIADVLAQHLGPSGTALEIASGTGQHVAHFARVFPRWTWQPSDPDVDHRRSVDAWVAHERLDNVLAALPLDVTKDEWPQGPFDALFNANMIHIAPWEVAKKMFEGAKSALASDGLLLVYGPFFWSNIPTADGNIAFDEQLRARNPEWGVRRLEDVQDLAGTHQFDCVDIIRMPANNLLVVFCDRFGARRQ